MQATYDDAVCRWCRCPFRAPAPGNGQPPAYCSRLHQEWAHRVAEGDYPAVECARCGRLDLLIAAPDWGICQTCGYQTDRPDLLPGQLAPTSIFQSYRELQATLAAYLEKTGS